MEDAIAGFAPHGHTEGIFIQWFMVNLLGTLRARAFPAWHFYFFEIISKLFLRIKCHAGPSSVGLYGTELR